MAEVYRARDTRLDRMVAIKILHGHLGSDPEVRRRFEREARTIAALSHPHVCTLYDLGHEDDVDFLVMEYLEGRSLAEALTERRLPLAQALRYGREIALALAAAHRRGIIHRDLKPGNVILTNTGARLVDFGLAKLSQSAAQGGATPASGEATKAGTDILAPVTAAGTILGTIPYMAPEQVEGREADSRSDIFAFGAVLYEMITGVRAFYGETAASVAAAILDRDPPPVSAREPLSPPALDRIVAACLAKNPDARWQDAGDLEIELRWIADDVAAGGSSVGLGTEAQGPVRQSSQSKERKLEQPSAPARFSITLPPDAPIALDRGLLPFAVAPDGRRLAYVARIQSGTQLYIRDIAEPSPRPIPGTEGARSPFFSPDGRWIAYITEGTLCKVPVFGGLPTIICEAGWVIGGADWTGLGIFFNSSFLPKPGIWLVDPDGGTPQPVVSGESGSNPAWPQLLPGGKAILLSMLLPDTTYKARVEVFSLETRRREVLVEGGAYHARYLSSGHLLYAKAGQLFVAPFDVANHRISGAPLPVLREAFIDEPIGWVANYCVSNGGLVAYLDKRADGIERTLMWVGLNGSVEPLPVAPGRMLFPRLSPDERLLAATIIRGDDYNIHVYDLQRGIWTRVTGDSLNDLAIWSPDGRSLTFTSDRAATASGWNLFRTRLDGSGVERLMESEFSQLPTSWSPDGEVLLYLELPSGSCHFLSKQGSNWQGQQFLHVPGRAVFEARFSPDGQLVAYTVVDEFSSRVDVYVSPFREPGAATLVSKDGGIDPVWAPDGSRLFYRHGSNQMMAVPIRTSPMLEVGAPELLFEGPVLGTTWLEYRSYDITRDGKRFIASGKLSEPRRLEVVLNWFEELKPLRGKQIANDR
jgi:serine/threonine-protein kinase